MPNFLIVDDSTIVRRMIMAALRPLQPTFGEAGSGLEAIEQLVLHPYDVVTLDLNMPDMHGLEFLRFVRNHSQLKNLPVVIISTRTDFEMKVRALEAGADLYISKPFTAEEVLQAVQSVLDCSQQDEISPGDGTDENSSES